MRRAVRCRARRWRSPTECLEVTLVHRQIARAVDASEEIASQVERGPAFPGVAVAQCRLERPPYDRGSGRLTLSGGGAQPGIEAVGNLDRQRSHVSSYYARPVIPALF